MTVPSPTAQEPLPPLMLCADLDHHGCQHATVIHDPDTGCMLCGCRRLVDQERLRRE